MNLKNIAFLLSLGPYIENEKIGCYVISESYLSNENSLNLKKNHQGRSFFIFSISRLEIRVNSIYQIQQNVFVKIQMYFLNSM